MMNPNRIPRQLQSAVHPQQDACLIDVPMLRRNGPSLAKCAKWRRRTLTIGDGSQLRSAAMRSAPLAILLAGILLWATSCAHVTGDVSTDPATQAQQGRQSFGDESKANADRLYDEGKRIFRDDTFGSEAFWGDTLQLHRAILGEKQGGVGPGLSPKDALKVGLKVDQVRIPK